MEATLICPKCQGVLRSYERNGIQIEQCTECRGVFLDRGELERLVEAESSYVAGQTDVGQFGAASSSREGGGYHGGHGGGKHGGTRRKRGFLGELFD